MNIFRRLWESLLNLHSHPIARAADKAKLAAQKHARAAAEVRYQESLVNFFSQQVEELDPNTQWWEFATAKQAEKDHTDELNVEIQREVIARSKLVACRSRLTSLRGDHEDEPERRQDPSPAPAAGVPTRSSGWVARPENTRRP